MTAALVATAIITLWSEQALSGWDELASMVISCSAARNPARSYETADVALNHDRTVLCFDGPIAPDQAPEPFHELQPNGFFVVRSRGGYVLSAIKLANILREKNATVVIYDHCLSACASYFLIASAKTYVMKGAVVAWHHRRRVIDCSAFGSVEGLRKRLRDQSLDPQQADVYCELTTLRREFFRQRGIDDRHTTEPQTIYIKKYMNLAARQGTDTDDVFWMWNPKNHGDYFKSIVVYQSYFNDQGEVDAALARSGLHTHVHYDPPSYYP